jgi:mRNA-degrading endonuclease RelE of RelBE toxin-antitoxin system
MKFNLFYTKEFHKQFNCLDKSVKVRVLREMEFLESNLLVGNL